MVAHGVHPRRRHERGQTAKELRRCQLGALAANRRAVSVVAGDDSVAAARQAGVEGKLSLLATGGLAALQLVEGRTRPGLAALEQA